MNELLWWINPGNQNVVRPDRNSWLLKKPSFLVSSPSLNWLLSARHHILLPTVACLAAASLQTADGLKEAREWAAILLVIFFVLFCFRARVQNGYIAPVASPVRHNSSHPEPSAQNVYFCQMLQHNVHNKRQQQEPYSSPFRRDRKTPKTYDFYLYGSI